MCVCVCVCVFASWLPLRISLSSYILLNLLSTSSRLLGEKLVISRGTKMLLEREKVGGNLFKDVKSFARD